MTYTPQSHVAYGDTWTAGQHNTLLDNIADGYDNETALREKVVLISLLNSLENVLVVDGIVSFYFVVPLKLNGWNLIDADASVYAPSSSGTPTFQIHNLSTGKDMLSTRITVDANEYNSYSAATQPVINTAQDGVLTGHLLRFDCDVAGTDTRGLVFILVFQTP